MPAFCILHPQPKTAPVMYPAQPFQDHDRISSVSYTPYLNIMPAVYPAQPTQDRDFVTVILHTRPRNVIVPASNPPHPTQGCASVCVLQTSSKVVSTIYPAHPTQDRDHTSIVPYTSSPPLLSINGTACTLHASRLLTA